MGIQYSTIKAYDNVKIPGEFRKVYEEECNFHKEKLIYNDKDGTFLLNAWLVSFPTPEKMELEYHQSGKLIRKFFEWRNPIEQKQGSIWDNLILYFKIKEILFHVIFEVVIEDEKIVDIYVRGKSLRQIL